jgi:hypothetical protein
MVAADIRHIRRSTATIASATLAGDGARVGEPVA